MKVIVQEWERVLVYRDGRFETELGPGRHRRRRGDRGGGRGGAPGSRGLSTSTSRRSADQVSRTVTGRPGACLAALVSDSWTIR